MSFYQLAKRRFSCRKYKPAMVEESLINQLFESVRVAPSAVNYQPWHFIVVRSTENKQKVVESYPREWFKSAPVYIIACGDHSKSWKRADGKDHLDIDLAIAIDHLTLQATEMGLASCWVCNFNKEVLKSAFYLPENIEPIAIIPIGYPEETEDPDLHLIKRKPIGQIVSYEKFPGI